MLEFFVPSTQSPMPLKHFLRQKGISLTLWRKIKRTGSVLINNTAVHSLSVNVHPGDHICINWTADCAITPMPLPLKICYEDDFLLVVDKPANLLVHPSRDANEPTLANGVIHYFQETGQALAFHPVHRLDRQTSGLVVIAKLPHVQHLLSKDNAKVLNRIYLAVVSGHPRDKGAIDSAIGRHPDSIIKRMVRPDGQHAVTNYHVIERFTNACLVEIQLLTGRTHQIRVHMAYIGHPLVGDDLYGGPTEYFARQALHAARISFLHPVTKQYLQITSDLPDDMRKLVASLREGDTLQIMSHY